MKKSLLLPATLLIGLWAQSAAAGMTRVEFSGEFSDYGSGTFSGFVEFESDQTSGIFSFTDAAVSAGTTVTQADETPMAVSAKSYNIGAFTGNQANPRDFLFLWEFGDFVDDDVTGFTGSRGLSLGFVDGFNPAGGEISGFELTCISFLCEAFDENTPFRSAAAAGTYTVSVPEPATLGMLGIGLLGLGVMRRRRAA